MTGFIPGERSFNTRCFVTVYRHDRDPIQLHAPDSQGAAGPGRGAPVSVIRAEHNKQTSSASGTFSVGLKQGTLDVKSEILPGDWVVIYWTRNGIPLHGVMGIIDSTSRSRRSASGVTVEDWQISGRDIGRIFELTEIWFDDYTNYGTNVGGQILGARMGFNPTGTPDQIVSNIVIAWLGAGDTPRGIVGGTWRWPRGLERLGNFFVEGFGLSVGGAPPKPIGAGITETPHLRGEGGNETALFQPNPGTMMQDLLREWSNPMLNELYYDVITSGLDGSTPQEPIPAMFLRERPFVNSDEGMASPWFHIPSVRLPRDAFSTSSIAKNDAERLNLFLIYSNSSGMISFEQTLGFPPSYDGESAARHGLRKWEQSTRFNAVANGTVSWVKEIAEWHSLITSWYGPNHEWLSGTASVPFILPEARIGHRLIIGEDDDVDREQFYVEGSRTSWEYGSAGSTSLQLTRGFAGSDVDLVSLVRSEQAKYQRGGTGELSAVSTSKVQRYAANVTEPRRPLADNARIR